jgi:hypothetical protein
MTAPATDRIALTSGGERPAAASGLPRAASQPPAPLRRPAAGPVTVPDDLHVSPPIVSGPGSSETTSHWRAHLQALFDYFAPDGRAEQLAVFRVASFYWRLDRAVRCETDEIASSLASAEFDAARLLDSDDPLDANDPVVRALPRDPTALRQRLKDAQLAALVLPDVMQATGPDPLPEAHAAVALRFITDYTAPRNTPSHAPPALPSPPPVGHWTGGSLRSALAHLATNRSLADVAAETVAYANATAALIERRLALIESIAARLRRQHVVPHSQVAARAQEYESHLSTLLDQALAQLDALQAARSPAHVSG